MERGGVFVAGHDIGCVYYVHGPKWRGALTQPAIRSSAPLVVPLQSASFKMLDEIKAPTKILNGFDTYVLMTYYTSIEPLTSFNKPPHVHEPYELLYETNLGTRNFLFGPRPRDTAHPGSGPARDLLKLCSPLLRLSTFFGTLRRSMLNCFNVSRVGPELAP